MGQNALQETQEGDLLLEEASTLCFLPPSGHHATQTRTNTRLLIPLPFYSAIFIWANIFL